MIVYIYDLRTTLQRVDKAAVSKASPASSMKNMGQTTKYTKPNKMFAQIKTEMEDKAKKRSKSQLVVQEVEYIDKQRNIAIRSDVSQIISHATLM